MESTTLFPDTNKKKRKKNTDSGFTLFTDNEHSEAVLFLGPKPYSAATDPLEIKKKWTRRIVFSSITLLLLFRIALPYYLLDHVNNMLAHRTDYCGSVEDVDVSLFKGGYTLKGVTFYELNNGQKETMPFFTAPAVDITLDWQKIMKKGALVGKIVLKNAAKVRPKKLYVKASIYQLKKAVKMLIYLPVDKFEISSKEVIGNTLSVNP